MATKYREIQSSGRVGTVSKKVIEAAVRGYMKTKKSARATIKRMAGSSLVQHPKVKG